MDVDELRLLLLFLCCCDLLVDELRLLLLFVVLICEIDSCSYGPVTRADTVLPHKFRETFRNIFVHFELKTKRHELFVNVKVSIFANPSDAHSHEDSRRCILMISTIISIMFTKFTSTTLLRRVGVSVARSFASSSCRHQQHLVIALGGNALLQRGQAMTMEHQQANIADAIQNLASILRDHTITFVHGNGPQVGMLVLQDAAYHDNHNSTTLDVLDAETEGMIGYLLEQEVDNVVPTKSTVTIVSQIIVNETDPAFQNPTKFIGPLYTDEQAESVLHLEPQPDGVYWKNKNGDYYKRDGDSLRRVVPSPLPQRMIELDAVKLLTDNDYIVICGGGGGIPVLRDDNGKLRGVEAVIDKDRVATMLGIGLGAHGLLILTDVAGAAIDYKTPHEKWIKSASPERLEDLMNHFPAGSMGPKISSAIEFVKTGGGWCTIGSLKEAHAMLNRQAGTLVTGEHGPNHIEYYH